jgi:hypothetical protein
MITRIFDQYWYNYDKTIKTDDIHQTPLPQAWGRIQEGVVFQNLRFSTWLKSSKNRVPRAVYFLPLIELTSFIAIIIINDRRQGLGAKGKTA